MENKAPSISFIIVNFKSAPYLKKCLASLEKKASHVSFEVIVVNNDPNPLNPEDFELPVKIINSGSNLGFGKGSNLGADSAAGEILCFINPDTEILTANLNSVLKKFEINPKMGAIGPDIVNAKGKTQKWTSGKELTFGILIQQNLGLKSQKNTDLERVVDWLSGACLFIRRELFQKMGGFDEKFFAYFEDVDLCKRLKNEGYEITRLPEIKVLHWEGKSFAESSRQKEIYYQSQVYYFQKHFGKMTGLLIKWMQVIFSPIVNS